MANDPQSLDNQHYENQEAKGESMVFKTVRLLINLLTNLLMFLTVFVCLVFSCRYEMDVFHLHIILSVLGYQFFMCQGILVLSKHNSWSFHLTKRLRSYLHISLQLIAATLVTAGSVFIMKEMPTHFHTAHGCFGILALILSLLGLLNGALIHFSQYLNNYINVFWLKYFHYITGISVLLLAAASLCTGFDSWPFRQWIGREDLVATLISFTLLFTILVCLDFWIVTFQKIKQVIMC